MPSNYKKLGDYISETNERNTSLNDYPLLGVSIQKIFMPSIANIIGTDMSTYKIVYRNQFAYGPVTSRNGDKISIALLNTHDAVLISQAYTSFSINDVNELDPEYLMMWFRRPEFDRYARFKSHGSAREIFDWQELCDIKLPIPSIEKQRAIVKEYNTIEQRINLNNQLIQKLEETAQAIYKRWFVDFEFPNEEGKPYKSSNGKMIYNEELEKEIPEGWDEAFISNFGKTITGKTPSSDNPEYFGDKMPFITPGDFKPNCKYIIASARSLSPDGVRSLSNKILDKGSIIVSCIGSDMGKVVIVDNACITNQQMNAIIIDEIFYSDYLYYTLKLISAELKSIAMGSSTMPMLNKTDFDKIVLLKPSNQILDVFQNHFKFYNKEVLFLLKESKLLNNLKDLLLSRLAKES